MHNSYKYQKLCDSFVKRHSRKETKATHRAIPFGNKCAIVFLFNGNLGIMRYLLFSIFFTVIG